MQIHDWLSFGLALLALLAAVGLVIEGSLRKRRQVRPLQRIGRIDKMEMTDEGLIVEGTFDKGVVLPGGGLQGLSIGFDLPRPTPEYDDHPMRRRVYCGGDKGRIHQDCHYPFPGVHPPHELFYPKED